MLEGKAIVRETDMAEEMQCHVMELAYQALDLHEVSDFQSIAQHIKQKVDEAYGPAWHCVVGVNFGSCITHVCGNFIFFHVEMTEFLVFKDGNDLNKSKDEAIGVLQKDEAIGVLLQKDEAIGVLQKDEAIGVLQKEEQEQNNNT